MGLFAFAFFFTLYTSSRVLFNTFNGTRGGDVIDSRCFALIRWNLLAEFSDRNNIEGLILLINDC